MAHGSSFDFSLRVNVHDGRAGDQLCTQCHQSPPARPIDGAGIAASTVRPRITSRPADGPDSRIPWTDEQIAAHSFHRADSAGSRCVSCHMSDVNWRLLMRRRDHTFQPPVPETTAAFGVPNACTTCHDDKPPEWAARQMDAWWGDGPRRARSARVATTMYQAASATRRPCRRWRPSPWTVPRARCCAPARWSSSGPRWRARHRRAAGAEPDLDVAGRPGGAGRSPTGPLDPRAFGALLGAASDPEPMVRASAVRTLGSLDSRDDRVLAVLTARLVDDARVVRARAAEALLALEVVTAPGRVGTALDRAQDDLAESLRSFPDSAPQQASLAWLYAQRGQTGEAEAAVAVAIAVDPTLARPYVIRGVLAARAGRFDDALASWRAAPRPRSEDAEHRPNDRRGPAPRDAAARPLIAPPGCYRGSSRRAGSPAKRWRASARSCDARSRSPSVVDSRIAVA